MEKSVFESVVISFRREVIGWLCGKYKNLNWEDAEDIVQDSSCELWKWCVNKNDLTKKDFVSMWKVMSRNIYTHWIVKTRSKEEWNDHRLQHGWEERDYGWYCGNESQIQKRELFYDSLDSLKDKDRQLVELILAKFKMKDIAEKLGYKSEQVARNRKHYVIKTLQEKLVLAA